MNPRTLLVGLFAVMLVASPIAAAQTSGPGLNYTSDKAPNPYITEDTLTIAAHDNAAMDSVLSYEDDNGEVTTLPATYNQSQTHPVGVRPDKIDADAYQLFPRVSGESENGQTWLNTSNWTKTSGAGSSMTISDADGTTASGVPAVSFDGSVASTEQASANFSEGVDITSDANKRVLMWVGNVDSLSASSNVSIRVYDADGDYKAAYIDPDLNAADDNVIANGTATGVVYQEKLSNLAVEGTGDGTLDSIQYVKVVVDEANAKITTVGLDVERKTMLDFGSHAYDTDGDGDVHDEDAETIEEWTQPDGTGVLTLTSLDTMGSWADSAVIHDLEVYDVKYRAQDLTDEENWDVEFSAAEDYPSYAQQLEVYYRLEVPSAIDLSHGSLSLNDTQGSVGERYAVVEVAEDTGDTEFENVSDSEFTSKKSLYDSKGDEHELDATVTAGDNYVVHMTLLLTDDEADTLADVSAMGGPTGKSGGFLGGIWNFITSPFGAIISIASAAGVAIRRLGGG